jgi:cell division protease FtsH
LGRQISEQRNYSEETAEQIDAEVRRLVDEAHKRASQILSDNRDKLDLVATSLLEHETLNAKEFNALFIENDVISTDTPSQGDVSQEESSSQEEDSPPSVIPPSTAPLPA